MSAGQRGQADAVLIGNVNVDLVMHPLDELPRWGEERAVPDLLFRPAGAVGYTALALARLGISPVVLGSVGNDQYGEWLVSSLRAAGIETGWIGTATEPTAISVAMVSRQGERAFVTYYGHLRELDPSAITTSLRSFREVRCALLSGYFLAPSLGPTGAVSILRACRSRGARTLLDPGWPPSGWDDGRRELAPVLREVDVLVPNYDEARELTGKEDLDDITDRLLDMGVGSVIVKLGPLGSAYATRKGVVIHEAAPRVDVVDTTGAGDVFNAGIIWGLLSGQEPQLMLRLANAVAAIAVSRIRDRYPSLHEGLALACSPSAGRGAT